MLPLDAYTDLSHLQYNRDGIGQVIYCLLYERRNKCKICEQIGKMEIYTKSKILYKRKYIEQYTNSFTNHHL